MKKVLIVIWGLLAISIILFVISVATMSTQTAWQMFSGVVVCGAIAFWGTFIVAIVELIRRKK